MRKLFVALLVVVMGTAGAAFAAEAVQPVDITCTGSTVYERPVWQKILSLGILGDSVERYERGFWPSVPGGVDSVRKVAARNSDFNVFMAAVMRSFPGSVRESEVVCTSDGQAPLRLTYRDGVFMIADMRFEDTTQDDGK